MDKQPKRKFWQPKGDESSQINLKLPNMATLMPRLRSYNSSSQPYGLSGNNGKDDGHKGHKHHESFFLGTFQDLNWKKDIKLKLQVSDWLKVRYSKKGGAGGGGVKERERERGRERESQLQMTPDHGEQV